MKILMEKSWLDLLKEEFKKPYMKNLQKFLEQEDTNESIIYPDKSKIFQAFRYFPYEQTKVVIMGQDPYHNPGQAHGLSFSVQNGVNPPPSLQNIYKELKADIGLESPDHGFLQGWANQGVLLLNATLTVRKNEPKSHYGKGWEIFTDHVVEKLSERKDPIVFLLWGKSAQEKCENIFSKFESHPHLVLKAAHPSPFSAYNGFFGSGHFSKTNAFLEKNNKTKIHWEKL